MAAKQWKPLEAYWPAERMMRDSERVIPMIEQRYRDAHPRGKDAGPAEVKSWRESVYELANVLCHHGLGGVYMFVEYRVAPDMDPIDVVLAGRHPDGGHSYVVVELKQWSGVERADPANPEGIKACSDCLAAGPGRLCATCAVRWVWIAGYRKHKLHPAAQVYDNLLSLQRHHSTFDDRYVKLAAAAYLHNAVSPDDQWITRVRPHRGVHVPTFTGRDLNKVQDFFAERFAPGSGDAAAEALLERRRETAPITDDIGEIVAGNLTFSLVGQQKAAVDAVVQELKNKTRRGAKKAFVIRGRAGTGKSLVALTLLGEANKARPAFDARYVSGGIASRDTFKRESPGNRGAFVPLIQVTRWEEDEVAMILCDEAHRLTERPMKNSFAMSDGPESSVEVVVKAARVPVFFIDGDQRLFGEEIWTPEALEEELLNLGVEVVPITLDRPLRAVGSATYDTWLQLLLRGEPVRWISDETEPFQLYYAENPEEMEDFLAEKQREGKSARMTAGLCWEWTDDSGTVPDVKLPGGWARPWNAGDNHKTLGVPKRKYWATDPGGFGQIGCVHTAQGLEYEWGGVIFGPDLTWDDQRWRVHREEVRSKAVRITDDDDLSRAIRNAYRVLMTRSLRGTVLYSVDPATRELFAELGVPRVPRP